MNREKASRLPVDLFINSASRPEDLKKTIASLKKHMKHSGPIYWGLNEDVFDKNASAACIGIASDFDTVMVTMPRGGQIRAITTVLINATKAKYMVRWCDDFEMIADVNLSDIIYVMEMHPYINQVVFFKGHVPDKKMGKQLEQVEYEGMKFGNVDRWSSLPCVMRTEFVLPRWLQAFSKVGNKDKGTWYSICDLFHREIDKDIGDFPVPNKWAIEVMGSLYYGAHGSAPVVRHTGNGKSRVFPKKRTVDNA